MENHIRVLILVLLSINALNANHLTFYHGLKLDTTNILNTIEVRSNTECVVRVRCFDTEGCSAINIEQDTLERECVLISANSSDIARLT